MGILKWGGRVVGGLLALIGAAGIPDDVKGWHGFIGDVADKMDADTARFAIVAVGVVLVLLGQFGGRVGGYLRSRLSSGHTISAPTERVQPKGSWDIEAAAETALPEFRTYVQKDIEDGFKLMARFEAFGKNWAKQSRRPIFTAKQKLQVSSRLVSDITKYANGLDREYPNRTKVAGEVAEWIHDVGVRISEGEAGAPEYFPVAITSLRFVTRGAQTNIRNWVNQAVEIWELRRSQDLSEACLRLENAWGDLSGVYSQVEDACDSALTAMGMPGGDDPIKFNLIQGAVFVRSYRVSRNSFAKRGWRSGNLSNYENMIEPWLETMTDALQSENPEAARQFRAEWESDVSTSWAGRDRLISRMLDEYGVASEQIPPIEG